MTKSPRSWIPIVSLLFLALVSGVAWRAELELRSGWMSLAWLNYFHWAVPICAFAFLVWVVCVARVRRSYSFAAALLAFAFVAYLAVDFAFHLYFAAGPSGLLAIAFLGDGDFDAGFRRLWVLHWVFPLLWALLPLVFCAICRAFGAQVSVGAALLSAVLFVLSWPLAVFVRGFFDQLGSQDLIHALKSGFIVPFLVVSLGFPLLRLSAVFCRRARIPKLSASCV